MNIKLFGKNAVIYAVGNVGLRMVSFFLIPLYTHSLSIENYGLLMTLILTIQFMLMMNCGMDLAIVRFTKEYEDENRIAELFGTSFFINTMAGLAVAFFSLTVLYPFFKIVLHLQNAFPFVGLACITAMFQSLVINLMSYYRARNKSVNYMLIGIGSAVVLLIISYLFLYIFRFGIFGALYAKIITYLITLLVLGFYVFSKTGFKISFSLAPRLFRFGFPLIFASGGELVIGGSSIYFLSIFSGLQAVAIYSLGYKLATILAIAIILPFQLSFQPFVFGNLDSPNIKKQISQLLTYLVLAVTAVSFCMILGSRFLLPLIAPPEYSPAYIFTILLLPAMAFISVHYFAETLLNAAQKTHIIGLTIGIATIIAVLMNYLLISSLQSYGAVISANVSFISIGLLLLVFGMKHFPVPIEWKRLGISLGLFVSVILLNLILFSADYIQFSFFNIIAILIIIFVLYLSFCNERERFYLKILLGKIKSVFL